MVENIGLVLEGGGMRGVFTSGILDYLMEKDIYFRNVYGVSAGACNGVSSVSKQIGRNKTINFDYCSDKRYASYYNLIKHKSVFGMKFIFEQIPYNEVPFDFDTYRKSEQAMFVGVTSLDSGKIVYFSKDEAIENVEVLKASCAIPIASEVISIDGKKYLDGGVSEPIPIIKSVEDGNFKHIVILTQDQTYRKKPSGATSIAKMLYRKYPAFIKTFENRHIVYNQYLEQVNNLEKQGRAFVFRPSQPVLFKKFEHDIEKLKALYNDAYTQIDKRYDDFLEFIKK